LNKDRYFLLQGTGTFMRASRREYKKSPVQFERDSWNSDLLYLPAFKIFFSSPSYRKYKPQPLLLIAPHARAMSNRLGFSSLRA